MKPIKIYRYEIDTINTPHLVGAYGGRYEANITKKATYLKLLINMTNKHAN